MIVDCHVHLNNYHAESRFPTEKSLSDLQSQLEKHGLDHAVVLTSYTVNQDRPSTARVLELLADEPRLSVVEGLGVTGPIPPDWEEIAARLREGKTRGLKFYPGYEHVYPHAKEFAPALDLAAKYDVPVMIHTGDTFAPRGKLKFAHPLHVDEVAVDHPDVKFIICHLGNPWFRDTAELLYKNENVFADISGLVLEEFTAPMEAHMRQELAELLLYSGDPAKILYGTDWPLVKMGPYRRFVDQLALEPEHKAMLMGDNAARLFRIPAGGRPTPASRADEGNVLRGAP